MLSKLIKELTVLWVGFLKDTSVLKYEYYKNALKNNVYSLSLKETIYTTKLNYLEFQYIYIKR